MFIDPIDQPFLEQTVCSLSSGELCTWRVFPLFLFLSRSISGSVTQFRILYNYVIAVIFSDKDWSKCKFQKTFASKRSCREGLVCKKRSFYVFGARMLYLFIRVCSTVWTYIYKQSYHQCKLTTVKNSWMKRRRKRNKSYERHSIDN